MRIKVKMEKNVKSGMSKVLELQTQIEQSIKQVEDLAEEQDEALKEQMIISKNLASNSRRR